MADNYCTPNFTTSLSSHQVVSTTAEAAHNITLIRFAGRHSSLASLHQHGRLPPAHGVPLGQADRRRSGLPRSGQEDLQHAGSGHPRPEPRVAGLRRLQRHPRRHRNVHVFGEQRVDIWGIICKSLYCMPECQPGFT